MLEFLESLPEGQEKQTDGELMAFLDQLPGEEGAEKAAVSGQEAAPKVKLDIKEPETPVTEAVKAPIAEKEVETEAPESRAKSEGATAMSANDHDSSAPVAPTVAAAGALLTSWWATAATHATSTFSQTAKLVDGVVSDVVADVVNDPSLARGLDMISNVIHTITFKDEVLEIVLIHDITAPVLASALRGIVQDTFEQVMSEQVEGSIEVRVTQRAAAATQGPPTWNVLTGTPSEASKLARANIQAATKDEDTTKTTKIYIAVVAYGATQSGVTFLCALQDTTHDMALECSSQAIPLQWSQWCLGEYSEAEQEGLPTVDPREWVEKWVTQSLCGSLGVLAQSYVIKRMGY